MHIIQVKLTARFNALLAEETRIQVTLEGKVLQVLTDLQPASR